MLQEILADIIFVYSTFRKRQLNSIFENIDNKMFGSKETISVANRLMGVFNLNGIPFRVGSSWSYFWYTTYNIGAFKLFIIDKDGGHDLEATYRLLGGYPFHQEVLEKKVMNQMCFINCFTNNYVQKWIRFLFFCICFYKVRYTYWLD